MSACRAPAAPRLPQASAASVQAGSTNNAEGGQVRRADWMGAHPAFDIETMVHDVALLRLSDPLDVTRSGVRPVRIVAANSGPSVSQLLTVSGWGAIYVSNKDSNRSETCRI